MTEYAPTEDADSELKEDYLTWLQSSEAAGNPNDFLDRLDPIVTY